MDKYKPTEEQKYFMQLAIYLAMENVKNGQGGPFGAVVVKDGKVVGQGANHVTTDNDPTAHAEVIAIRNACKNLNTFQLTDCEIYASCEPCPMCLGAIYWARPKKLFFATTRADAADAGFDDSYIYKQLTLPINLRKLETHDILRESSLSVFHLWKETLEKTDY